MAYGWDHRMAGFFRMGTTFGKLEDTMMCGSWLEPSFCGKGSLAAKVKTSGATTIHRLSP